MADDLVEIRRPQDIIFIGELGQPSLGDFEVFPAVEYVEQTVFQLVWVLSHHPVQVDEVAVGIVEHLTDGALLVEKDGTPAPEHFHVDHVLVAGWKPFDDRGEQGLFSTDPWNDRLDRSPPSFVYRFFTAWLCPGIPPAGTPPGSGLSQ